MADRKTVLIVDDDRDFADSLRIVLEAGGFDVECASSARQCMLAVRQKVPDLILLDVMMEKLVSGLQVDYELRADPEFKDIPIVIVSAILDQTGFDVAGAKNSPSTAADEFLNKPVKPEVLLATVNRLLEKRGSGSARN